MPAYSFEALDAQGSTQKGLIDADTAKAARGLLRARALVPLSVEPAVNVGADGKGTGAQVACSDPAVAEPSPVGGELQVEVGIPGGEGGLDFLPLEEGAELRLQTFGQGGTHLLVGVRCTGFGSRAFVSATLRNLSTGVEVREPPPASPQLLYCEEEVCDLVPYLVHASGLTELPEQRDGLRVLLTASVESRAGAKAEAAREVVLSTADL